MSPEQLPVDELREKLKDLGYLRTGVDRFVLAPARQERSPARIALGAGARVGLLAGALLGPAAAIGIAARLPQLVTGTRDAIVVAIYLALLFTLAGAAITLATAFLARGAVRLSGKSGARVARLAPAVAGGAVTAACLAYWRFGGGPSIPALHGARPCGLPGSGRRGLDQPRHRSCGRGHCRRLAGPRFSGAARETVDRPSPHRVRPPRRRVCGRRGPSRGDRAPRGHVRTHAGIRCNPNRSARHRDRHRRLDPALVGLSDLLPDPTKPTAIASVPSAADSDPARVWTTIATGMPPASHGITALELRVAGLEGAVAPEGSPTARAITATTGLLRLGRPAIASGTQRKLKTFWEVAAEKGLSTAVVNWWATWPASGPSTVLSDRALLRLERTGPLDAEIWPPQLYDRLRSEWPRLSEEARRLAEKAFEGIEPAALRSVLIRSATFDATVVLLPCIRR